MREDKLRIYITCAQWQVSPNEEFIGSSLEKVCASVDEAIELMEDAFKRASMKRRYNCIQYDYSEWLNDGHTKLAVYSHISFCKFKSIYTIGDEWESNLNPDEKPWLI